MNNYAISFAASKQGKEIGILDASGRWGPQIEKWLDDWQAEIPIHSFKTVFKFLSYLDEDLYQTDRQRFFVVNPMESVLKNPNAIVNTIGKHPVLQGKSLVLISEADVKWQSLSRQVEYTFWKGEQKKLNQLLKTSGFLEEAL